MRNFAAFVAIAVVATALLNCSSKSDDKPNQSTMDAAIPDPDPGPAPSDDGGMQPDAPSTLAACATSGVKVTSADYTLPSGYSTSAFFTTSETTPDCNNNANAPAFAALDVDKDGLPDLVVTATCADPQVGTSKWLVYKGGAAGFAATSVNYTLPSGYASQAFPATLGTLSCNGGENGPRFTTFDIDKDGIPDLVVTATCDDPQVGTGKWLVYKGGATGFAATPASYALPTGYGSAAFDAPSEPAVCNGNNAPGFTTLDVDHDGLLDLVVTESCDDVDVGTTKWLVYKGSATGFAATAATHTLPGGFDPNAFSATSVTFPSCQGGVNLPAFATLDLDNDGHLDLVVTESCNDPQVGTSKWLVYKGAASGFAAASTSYTLPTGYSTDAFVRTTDVAECAGGSNVPSFSLLDVDRDGRPDLVLTSTCKDAQVGASKWLVHKGGATGFAAMPGTFALPGGYTSIPFNSLGATGTLCTNGDNAPAFAVLDVDKDKVPDFVITQTCKDPQVGTSKWLVYHSVCTP